MGIRRPQRNRSSELVNEDIPKGNVLLIDENGDNLGIVSRDVALDKAYDAGLDLVVVAAQSDPLVAKIMDHSKYRYDQQKRLKEMKRNQVVVNLKEIRLSPTIEMHDFNTKLKHAQRFIGDGDKVKLSIRFYGRMLAHTDIGMETMNKFVEELGESIIVEAKPKMEGRNMIAILAPNTKQ
ncbi:MAG: translation initiation factor IF-3 [Acholeplasmataceae bacterium]|nr:translation initiation factor IF-3 [Acholeplasmataceae bacterium]